MKIYFFLICLFLFISVSSCKKKTITDPYGDPKYFVKVHVVSEPSAVGYNFALNDGDSFVLRTYELTNDKYVENYKMRELYPFRLNVLNWDDKYLYWDSNIVIDDQKESFVIPLTMDTNKILRLLMSEVVMEKYSIDFDIPTGSGISVYVQDMTSVNKYIDVFTSTTNTNKVGKIFFLKGMNAVITATNAGGIPIASWQVNTGDLKTHPAETEIVINNISANYEITALQN